MDPRIRTLPSLLLVVAFLLGVSACGEEQLSLPPATIDGGEIESSGDATVGTTGSTGSTGGTGSDGGSDAAVASALSGTQIHDVLMAINARAIGTALHVQPRLASPAVAAFAHTLLAEHTISERDLTAQMSRGGIASIDSPLTTMLRGEAVTKDDQLATLRGEELDRAYVTSQARAQQRALEIIDTALVPNVMSDELRSTILHVFRPMVEHHLQMARSLQASLGAK